LLLAPKPKLGRPTAEDALLRAEYAASVCKLILEIEPRLDFKVSARGWCYVLEGEGAVNKGDFDIAEKLINEARARGDLPLDICADDAKRRTHGLEDLDEPDVKAHARELSRYFLRHAHETYQPFSFWQDEPVYLEIVVEKIDLVGLFSPVCEEFHVPITNAGGCSDLNSRAQLMLRLKKWEGQGKQCVVQYWTDHDPDGLKIAEDFRDNLLGLKHSVVEGEPIDWSPDDLIIERMGLTKKQIDDLGLTWIDGLETGSKKNLADPKHANFKRNYVQDYLNTIGARKCEANALLRQVPEARELCRESILRWISNSAVAEYEKKIGRERHKLKKAIRVQMREWK
jgi:hypothetical protein